VNGRVDGVLVIDKPAGPTSHDVVAVARRALREKRVGHTGTLDPLATGVLPLVLGRATRLATFLSATEKEYEADVRLGASTATYDAADRLAHGGLPPAAPDVTREQIERALVQYRGEFDQTPPPFSAKKIAGVPAYQLARKDAPAALKAVRVTVHALEILALDDGLLRLRMRTSAGFYVRSLAHDLGAQLGCGAHLEGLRRTRAGSFGLDAAVPLDELAERPETAAAKRIPLERLAPELPAVVLNERGSRRASHGNPLALNDLAQMGSGPVFDARPLDWGQAPFRVRLFDAGGRLIGIAEAGADRVLRPSIVLV